MRRLGLGTEESHARTQRSVDHLWPYAFQLFESGDRRDRILIEEGIFPDTRALEETGAARSSLFLPIVSSKHPKSRPETPFDRREHTEHLATLLAELQKVARLDPLAAW